MKGLQIPVCGQSISYSDLAAKITAVTGMKATYRECSVEEFEAKADNSENSRKEIGALGHWLEVAPDNKTCYGTIEMDRLIKVERDLGIKALSWEMFLRRTGWRGPPK